MVTDLFELYSLKNVKNLLSLVLFGKNLDLTSIRSLQEDMTWLKFINENISKLNINLQRILRMLSIASNMLLLILHNTAIFLHKQHNKSINDLQITTYIFVVIFQAYLKLNK